MRGLAVASLLVLSPACAVILDFQEPTDREDASASSSVAEDGSSPYDDDGAPDRSPGWGDEPGSHKEPEDAEGGDAEDVDDAETGVPDGALADEDAESDTGARPIECSSCLPLVPNGWYGPLAVHEGYGGGAAPPCSGDFPNKIYDGLSNPDAPSAQCSCSCSAPAGVTCSAPQTKFFDDPTCLLTCGSPNGDGALTCAKPGTTYCDAKKISAFSVTASTASGGTCTPSRTAAVPPMTWGAQIRLCGRANVAASCADGTCVGATLPPFDATNRCVLRPGTWECPAGYPQRRVFYEGGSDTRSCSSCTCGAAAGVTCEASVSTYGSSSCSGAPTTTKRVPVACTSTTGVERLSVSTPTPTGGSCPTSGGVPLGSFTPETPSTVCCVE